MVRYCIILEHILLIGKHTLLWWQEEEREKEKDGQNDSGSGSRSLRGWKTWP